ncbi:MAG: helix-turn-helix domain-containing protein [Pseudomonadota bacterium]|nr:helix-turn-helix domain-containing protein [Pseudomonadota bacterium]
MNKPLIATAKHQAKRDAVYDAASVVFAQYGFRRTTMNDIAKSAGISRPALYLMFENKEDLFQGLAAHRLDQAIDSALSVLQGNGKIADRFRESLLVFEQIFYEPIADSPHGTELMDISLSLASEIMTKKLARFHAALTKSLSEAEARGQITFARTPMKPRAFVELLFTALNGVKKRALNTAEFRKLVRQLTEIFLLSIAPEHSD